MSRILLTTILLVAYIPAFGQTMWHQHQVPLQAIRSNDLQPADVDGDGQLDLVVASYEGNSISWLKNWDNQFSFTELTVDPAFYHALAVRGADFDNDGHTDLVAIAKHEHEIRLYWNLGQGQSWFMVVIAPEIRFNALLDVGDVDNDGDADILIEDYDGFHLYENTNSGSEWVVHHADLALGELDDMHLYDVDADGDLDVVALGTFNNVAGISWFENPGNGSGWIYHEIGTVTRSTSICVGELNGDGTVCVASVSQGRPHIWQSQDPVNDWDVTLVDERWFEKAVTLSDFDQDGDLDLCGSYRNLVEIVWYENRGTLGWRPHQVECVDDYLPTFMTAVDLNGDGYPDLAELSGSQSRVTVWENNLSNVDYALTTTPRNRPILIGPSGGNFGFSWSAWNRTAQGVPVDVWGEIRFTSGELVRAFNVHPGLILPANWQRGEVRWEYIPYNMPSGEFHFIANLGTWPDQVVAADTFNVTKQPHPGLDITSNGMAELLTDGKLSLDCSPNPFNAMTTVRVALPEAAELRVVVYNVAGQQVAELVNGAVAAGSHAYTFDATTLASGLYFVRAAVPGQLDQTQKVMLVR